MKPYLDKILEKRELKDLEETRTHLLTCFEEINCFLLPHPGLKVTKKQFDGNIQDINVDFINLLKVYMDNIFTKKLKPKVINSQELTANELSRYFIKYTEIFKDKTTFPEAKTLLSATAEINNINAFEKAFNVYIYYYLLLIDIQIQDG